MKFQRDIYKDLRILEKSIGEGDEENSNLDLFSLEMFENIAYTMAKHADPQIPNEVDEWLDGFNTFSIYQVLTALGSGRYTDLYQLAYVSADVLLPVLAFT